MSNISESHKDDDSQADPPATTTPGPVRGANLGHNKK